MLCYSYSAYSPFFRRNVQKVFLWKVSYTILKKIITILDKYQQQFKGLVTTEYQL